MTKKEIQVGDIYVFKYSHHAIVLDGTDMDGVFGFRDVYTGATGAKDDYTILQHYTLAKKAPRYKRLLGIYYIPDNNG